MNKTFFLTIVLILSIMSLPGVAMSNEGFTDVDVCDRFPFDFSVPGGWKLEKYEIYVLWPEGSKIEGYDSSKTISLLCEDKSHVIFSEKLKSEEKSLLNRGGIEPDLESQGSYKVIGTQNLKTADNKNVLVKLFRDQHNHKIQIGYLEEPDCIISFSSYNANASKMKALEKVIRSYHRIKK